MSEPSKSPSAPCHCEAFPSNWPATSGFGVVEFVQVGQAPHAQYVRRRWGMLVCSFLCQEQSDSYFHSCTFPSSFHLPWETHFWSCGLGQVFIRIFGQFLYPGQRGQQTIDVHEEFIPQGVQSGKMTSSRQCGNLEWTWNKYRLRLI